MIVNEREANFPLSNQKIWETKIIDMKSTEVYGVAFDDLGNIIDPKAVKTNESAEHARKYGKLEVDLYDKLQKIQSEEKIKVALWLTPINIPSGNSTTPGESWGCGYMKIYNRVLNMVFSDYAGVYTSGANLNTGVWYTVEHVVTPTFNRVTANGVSTTNTENHADNRYIGFGVNYQNAKHGWIGDKELFFA